MLKRNLKQNATRLWLVAAGLLSVFLSAPVRAANPHSAAEICAAAELASKPTKLNKKAKPNSLQATPSAGKSEIAPLTADLIRHGKQTLARLNQICNARVVLIREFGKSTGSSGALSKSLQLLNLEAAICRFVAPTVEGIKLFVYFRRMRLTLSETLPVVALLPFGTPRLFVVVLVVMTEAVLVAIEVFGQDSFDYQTTTLVDRQP